MCVTPVEALVKLKYNSIIITAIAKHWKCLQIPDMVT